jgi:hypothetical protein
MLYGSNPGPRPSPSNHPHSVVEIWTPLGCRESDRRENRHRRTINKVLLYNADQMREHNEQSRQGFLLLQTDAIQTVQRALKKGDVQTAYRLLTDCGTVPNRQVTAEYQEPTPALTAEKKYVAEFVETVMERGKDYGDRR